MKHERTTRRSVRTKGDETATLPPFTANSTTLERNSDAEAGDLWARRSSGRVRRWWRFPDRHEAGDADTHAGSLTLERDGVRSAGLNQPGADTHDHARWRVYRECRSVRRRSASGNHARP